MKYEDHEQYENILDESGALAREFLTLVRIVEVEQLLLDEGAFIGFFKWLGLPPPIFSFRF